MSLIAWVFIGVAMLVCLLLGAFFIRQRFAAAALDAAMQRLSTTATGTVLTALAGAMRENRRMRRALRELRRIVDDPDCSGPRLRAAVHGVLDRLQDDQE